MKIRSGNDPNGEKFGVRGDRHVQKSGSVLGQDQDNFVIIPLSTFLKVRGHGTAQRWR